MKSVYYYSEPPESLTKSIFLAGPSPRTPDIHSWRKDALKILEEKRYDGVVFIPEEESGNDKSRYDWSLAPNWEHRMLDIADIVLFWVPRDVEMLQNGEQKLPGFTTNVEFGHWVNSGKTVLGHPQKAPHTAYLRFMADKFHVSTQFTLEETIDKALKIIGDGALRTGGEREIPLHIWRMRAFQKWYRAQKNAGNRLDGAKIEWISRVRGKPEIVFAAAIRPNIYIASEKRNKINDPIVVRLDISSAVLYKSADNLMDTQVVLVKEFRLAGSTDDGFIWELPGGSSGYIEDPLEVVIEEIHEEVGLQINKDRIVNHEARQLAGTMLSHKSHLYSTELTDSELVWLKSQKGIPHGSDYPDNPTGEQAYTEILTLREIMMYNLVDWSNLGMIVSVLLKKEG